MKRLFLIMICFVFLFAAFPVSASAAQETMKVDKVTFTETGKDSYTVSWKISQASVNMNVKVYISVSDHDYEAPNFELGSIKSGSEGSVSVRVSDVDSGYYHFMIGVTTMRGTVTYAFSKEAIFYDNTAGAAPLRGISVGRNGSTLYAVWDDETPAILSIYDADTKEFLVSEYGYEKPIQAVIPAGHKDVYAGVAAFDGSGGRFTPILCPKEDLPETKGIFSEEEVTNQQEQSLVLPDNTRLFLNGNECEITENTCPLILEEGENRLVAFVSDGANGTSAEEKTVVLDTIPPELTIESPGTSVRTTKDRIFIQGYAESDAFVTCDNDAVAMVGDCFSIEKMISLGTHQINVSALDKAGNSTIYTIEVKRSFFSNWILKLILIVLIAAAGAAAEAYFLIFRQRRKKKDD